MRKFLLAAALVYGLSSAEMPVREVSYGRAILPGGPIPRFDRGYLIFTERRPGFLEVYGPDGMRVFRNDLLDPKGGAAHLYDLAVDPDGTFVAVIGYEAEPYIYRGALVLLDRAGKPVRYVETGLYMPSQLCIDDNHYIWTFGWQRDPNDNGRAERDYFQVHRYTRDGKPAGAFLHRGLFPVGLDPFGELRGTPRAAADRVGVVAYPGRAATRPEWVELDLNGNLIGRWALGSDRSLAFTPDARLYTILPGGIALFDRATSSWKVVQPKPDIQAGLLLGAQDNELVLSARSPDYRLFWVALSH